MYLFSSPRCLKNQSNVSKRKAGVVDSGSRGRSAVWSDIFWVVFCILTCQHCTILLQALQPMSWASGAISECAWSMCPGKMAKSVVDSRLHRLSSFSGLRWCEFNLSRWFAFGWWYFWMRSTQSYWNNQYRCWTPELGANAGEMKVFCFCFLRENKVP